MDAKKISAKKCYIDFIFSEVQMPLTQVLKTYTD